MRRAPAIHRLGTGNPDAKPAPDLLAPKRGVVGRYRAVAQDDAADSSAAGRLCIDVGFKLYLPLSPAQARHRTLGEIVSVDTGIFLNNHLLENGPAVRKDAWEFSDWEKFASR